MNFKFTKTHLTLLDDDCNGGSSFSPLSNSNKLGESQDHVEKETPLEDHSQSLFSTHNGNCNGRNPPNFHLSDDILGLETPANQPFVLRGLKRILVMPARYFLPFRALLKGERIQDFEDIGKVQGELPGSVASKFERLNPTSIRDAYGRRPSDLLYDENFIHTI